jgi:hypothetical protein
MTTITNPAHRSVAILKLPLKVPALIQYVQNIVKAMTANAAFPTPTPPLAEVTAAITALNTAETATLTRVTGAVATRNAARIALLALLQQLKGCIQTAADANVENATPIIESAGIAVRKAPVRPPRVFNATAGPTTGSVKLVAAAAARRASYEWETSADGGKTWVPAPPTLQAKTTVLGLAAGTTVQFRYRAVTKTGGGDWSQPVSLLVK